MTRFDDPAGAGNCPTDCSLRQAIAAIGSGGTITLPAGTYKLTQGELDVLTTVTIQGAGARTTIIDQTNPTTSDRVLEVGNSQTTPTVTLTISGVTIEGGNTGSDTAEQEFGFGGGILVAESATLDMSQSTVVDNFAQMEGGGIDVQGALTLDRSLIESNEADGTVGANGRGGGIEPAGNSATVTNTSILDNFATLDGGGIFAFDAITLTNDTLAGNTSEGGSTTGNDVGASGNVTAENTIFDSSTTSSATHNCTNSTTGGTLVVTHGDNISSDATCVGTDEVGDLSSTDPALGPLQNNGGPTDTEAPSPGSRAIGAATSGCPATDQRGVARSTPCTVGAVEGAEGPIVDFASVTNFSDISATVSDNSINPNGADTTVVVEYGTTSNYGQTTSSVDIGLTTQSPYSQSLTGLSPDTTYHFRFDATNSNGTTESPDQTFTTGPQLTGTVGSVVTLSNQNVGSVDGCPASVQVDWGDGTAVDTVTPTCNNIDAFVTDSHTYAAPGHYDIAIKVQGRTFGAGALVAQKTPTISTTLSTTSITAGGSASDSATLTGATSSAGGTVTYTVYSDSSCTAGAQPAGTVTVTNGVVPGSNMVSFPNAGTFFWQAAYSGDTNNAAATSACASEMLTVSAPAPSGGGGGGGGASAPATSPPAVAAQSVQVVTGTSATVTASINPNGLPTTYVVEYGPNSSYGQTTSAASAGSGTGSQQVTATIPGLSPSSSYHYRFVATNSAGVFNGPDQSFITTTGGTTDLTSETPPPPVQGVSANVLPFLGTVLVDGKPLLVGEQIPFGATIDARHGTVVLEAMDNGVLQVFQFAGGVFVITQGSDGTTILTLTGGNFAGICGTTRGTRHGTIKVVRNGTRMLAGAVAKSAPPPPVPPGSKPLTVRSLWGNGHGHFSVVGKYAAATVRGTNFHVVDRCDGTLVHVRRGIVAVLIARTGKTVLLTVGQSYLAQ